MPSQSDIDAARVVLERLGVSPEDLMTLSPEQTSSSVPTFGEFISRVDGLVSPGTRRCYGTYWRKVLAVWSSRRLDEPLPSEIAALAERIRADAVARRSGRDGRSAAEHLIGALRCVYRVAADDGVIKASDDPSRKVRKPKRLPTRRRGLENDLLSKITDAAATTGDDPALDALVIRLHLESAARRGGALAMRLRDLDEEQSLVQLHEKGGTSRWQPVSPTLMTHLVDHARLRGARDPDSKVLRYFSGRPLTYRRYDGLWLRLGEYVEPVHKQLISTHWLRHTTLRWVERTFGFAVAQAYAGHADGTAEQHGATATYVKAGIQEVAAALSMLTGERHPLADGDLYRSG